MLITRTLIAFGAVFALGITAAAAQQAPTGTTGPTVATAPPPAVTATVTTPPPHQTTSPPPVGVAGSFESLSPGNRAIATSLYRAQTGPFRWSRDQIATAKLSGDGWGQIFHEMRRDGLIQAKSLGQLIRRDAGRHFVRRDRDDFGHGERHDLARHDRDDHHSAVRHHHEITVTSASGASHVLSQGRWRQGTGASAPAMSHTGTGTPASTSAHHAPAGAQFSETALASGSIPHGAAGHHGK